MLRQALILLFVSFEVLFCTTLHRYRYQLSTLLTPHSTLLTPHSTLLTPHSTLLVFTLQHKERLLMSDDLRVNRIACRTTERQVVYGIQHIGLAHPVPANEAVHLGRQLQRSLRNILIIEYR